MIKISVIVLFTFLLSEIIVQAQSASIEKNVVATSGGSYFNGSTFVMDYTIGEMSILTLGDASNYLTQGFQQPFSDPGVTILENADNEISILYYPNPTSDYLTINIMNAENQEFKVELFNILGQSISSQTGFAGFSGIANFNFDLKNCISGNYYVRISSSNHLLKNFKILKINN